jgi:5-methylcytosine-specific restriction endonuclease McrA
VAIIPGIQICIPQYSNRAADVIAGMESLLIARKLGRISRRVFLVAWSKKRLALRLTPDYEQLRTRICEEAKGMCERCHARAGDHMHHLTPVVYEPSRALDRKNVKWVCVVCHDDEDQEAVNRAKRHIARRRLKLEAKTQTEARKHL